MKIELQKHEFLALSAKQKVRFGGTKHVYEVIKGPADESEIRRIIENTAGVEKAFLFSIRDLSAIEYTDKIVSMYINRHLEGDIDFDELQDLPIVANSIEFEELAN